MKFAGSRRAILLGRRRTAVAVLAAPIISNVTLSQLYGTAAIMSWDTQVPSTSQIEYGTTTGYGSLTTLDPTLSLFHSMQITGLDEESVLHARPRSKNASAVETVGSDSTITLQLQLPDVGPMAGLQIQYADDYSDLSVTEFQQFTGASVAGPNIIRHLVMGAGSTGLTEDFQMNIWVESLTMEALSGFANNGASAASDGSDDGNDGLTEETQTSIIGGSGGSGPLPGGGGGATDSASVSGGASASAIGNNGSDGEQSQTDLAFAFIQGGAGGNSTGMAVSSAWAMGQQVGSNPGDYGCGGGGDGGAASGRATGGGGGGGGGPISIVGNTLTTHATAYFQSLGGAGSIGTGGGASGQQGGKGTLYLAFRAKTTSTFIYSDVYAIVLMEIQDVPGNFTLVDRSATPTMTWNNL